MANSAIKSPITFESTNMDSDYDDDLIQQYQIIDFEIMNFVKVQQEKLRQLESKILEKYACKHLSITKKGQLFCNDVNECIECCGHFRCTYFKPLKKVGV